MFQTYLQGHVTYPSPGSTIVNKRLWLLSKPLISLVDTIMHQLYIYMYHPYAKHWIHVILHRVVSSHHPKWKEAFLSIHSIGAMKRTRDEDFLPTETKIQRRLLQSHHKHLSLIQRSASPLFPICS